MLRIAVVAALLGVATCATLPETTQLNAGVAAQPTLEAALVRLLPSFDTIYVFCYTLATFDQCAHYTRPAR